MDGPSTAPAIDMVHILISRGADVTLTDSKGHSALFYAVQVNECEIVDTLLANGKHHTLITDIIICPLTNTHTCIIGQRQYVCLSSQNFSPLH